MEYSILVFVESVSGASLHEYNYCLFLVSINV